MEAGLKFPETIVLSNEAVRFCLDALYDDLFDEHDFARVRDGASEELRAACVAYKAKHAIADLETLGQFYAWTWRERLASQFDGRRRQGLCIHLRMMKRAQKSAPEFVRVTTQSLAGVFAVGKTASSLQHQTGVGILRRLVCSQHYFRWCRQGGDPHLGRYLAEYCERKMPSF
ncbi:MAG: hypothetical protein IID41_14480 [Planctomycetes bacterium]|nr:hypothetical protein [Planctomycetota bacterium]